MIPPPDKIDHIGHRHPAARYHPFQRATQFFTTCGRNANHLPILLGQRPAQWMTALFIEQPAQVLNQVHLGQLGLGPRRFQPLLGRRLVENLLDRLLWMRRLSRMSQIFLDDSNGLGQGLHRRLGKGGTLRTIQRPTGAAHPQGAAAPTGRRSCRPSGEKTATTLDSRQANDKMTVSVPLVVRPPVTSGVALPCGRAAHQPGCTRSRSRDLLCRSAPNLRVPRHRFFRSFVVLHHLSTARSK